MKNICSTIKILVICITIGFLLISCSNVSDIKIQNHNAYKQIPLLSKQPPLVQSTIEKKHEINKQGIISTSTPSPDENIVDSHIKSRFSDTHSLLMIKFLNIK